MEFNLVFSLVGVVWQMFADTPQHSASIFRAEEQAKQVARGLQEA
jgi:hypothetical protein